MVDLETGQEMFGRIAGTTIATMTVWADANERVLRELVEFSAATAKEGVRLYTELQQGAIEALRGSQAGAGDPVAACQKALSLLEAQAQALGRSAERLQTSAEQAGKDIHTTYTAAIAKLKDVYSRS